MNSWTGRPPEAASTAARRVGRRRIVSALGIVCAALLFGGSASAGTAEYHQGALRAALWLGSVQNADGSWGSDPATRVVYTSTVVDGLRDQGRRGNAYHRGVTWLENHAAPNPDARARRISALVPLGGDVSSDRAALVAESRPVVGLGNGLTPIRGKLGSACGGVVAERTSWLAVGNYSTELRTAGLRAKTHEPAASGIVFHSSTHA